MKFERHLNAKEFHGLALYTPFVVLHRGEERLYVKYNETKAIRIEPEPINAVLCRKEDFVEGVPCFPVVDIPTIIY